MLIFLYTRNCTGSLNDENKLQFDKKNNKLKKLKNPEKSLKCLVS